MTTIYTDKPLPERRAFDFYPTPLGFCRGALDWLYQGRKVAPPNYVLDPGCGEGPWGRAVRERFACFHKEWDDLRCGPRMSGVDIRPLPLPPGYHSIACAPFEEWQGPADHYGLIVGNPPFYQAEAFVRRSLALLKQPFGKYPGGNLIFLLPLTFMESQERGFGLFKEHPPKRVGVVIRRVSFTGNGKTPPKAYALFNWQPGYTGPTALEWMDFTYAPEDLNRDRKPELD